MEFRRLEKKDKEAYRRFIENWGEEPIQPFSASERTDDYDSLLQLLEEEIEGKKNGFLVTPFSCLKRITS